MTTATSTDTPCKHEWQTEDELIRRYRTPEEQHRQDKANDMNPEVNAGNAPLSATLVVKKCKNCGEKYNVDYHFN